MPYKINTNTNPGDSSHFGPDDINKFSKYLSSVDLSATDPADIATQTYYRSSKLQIRDPSNTRSVIIAATDGNGADRTVTFPVLSSNQNIVTTSAAQTLTNKTMDWNSNTFLNFPSGGGGSGDMILANIQTVTGAKTFNDGTLLLRNPANTFSSTIKSGAQTAAQTFTFPVTASDTILTAAATQTLTNKTLTAPVISSISNTGTLTLPTSTDTIVGRATTDTLSNKTITAATNTITDTGTLTGDILKSNGTKFARFGMGTANQLLAVNSGGTDLVWTTPAGGGDMALATVQTVTAAKTFNDGTLLLRNPANTFSATIKSGAQTAAQTFTFPVTASDTISTVAAKVTLTNKIVSYNDGTTDRAVISGANLFTQPGIRIDPAGAGVQSMIDLIPNQAVNAAGVGGGVRVRANNDLTNWDLCEFQYDGANYVFGPNRSGTATAKPLILRVAGTSMITLSADATTINHNSKLLANSVMNIDSNTLKHSTTNAAGDILKSDGTKFVRLARGTASQVLAVNAGGTDLAWTTPAGGGGGSTTITPDYVVYISGGNYVAMDTTGATISNANFSSLLLTINTNLSSGGSIFIKKGTYDLDTWTTLTNSIDIYGAGRGKTIIRRTNTGTNGTLTLSGANVSVMHLTMDGNYPTNSSNGFGELGMDGNYALVHDCEIKNWKHIGISSSAANFEVSNCVITGADVTEVSRYGIWCAGSTTQNNIIVNNNIQKCAYNAWLNGGYTLAANNYVALCASNAGGQVGADLNGKKTIIANNHFGPGRAGSDGIEVFWGEHLIVGNTIDAQVNYGILVWGTGGGGTPGPTVITGNTIKNSQGYGILVHGPSGSQHFIITSNLCYDDQVTKTQDRGIYIEDTSANHYIVQNNMCYGNTVSQITDSGTGTDKIVSNNILA